LGYSHGLILYAPFYFVVRPFLHPFVAHNATIFLVIECGIVCLYLLFRKFGRLSAIEAIVLTAFFATSQNVINGSTTAWSQRASVFLIPPILLLTLFSLRMPAGRPRLALASLSGLLAALMLVQDFPAAMFGIIVLLLMSGPFIGATSRRSWVIAFGAGVIAGALVFLWIYLPVYREHPGFDISQLLLDKRDPSQWHSVSDFFDDVHPYSLRPFALTALAAILVWIPFFKFDRRMRIYALWLALVAAFVFVIPFRFGTFSIWIPLARWLPGFGALRDPKRIIHLYELGVVLAMAFVMTRPSASRQFRGVITLLALVLIATNWNPDTFEFNRPIAVYEQWVDAPIAVDRTCRSFFIRDASDAYMSRTDNMWALYGADSLFIAMKYSVPTLNGYSAWAPRDWDLANPQNSDYNRHVDEWIRRNRLTNVCALDIDLRTMQPHQVARTIDPTR
jgi:hypothetical protein